MKKTGFCLLLSAALSVILWLPLYSNTQTQVPPASDELTLKDLPDGEGKDILVAACGSCHSVERSIAQRRTKEQWRATVDGMIARGTQMFIEEADTLVEYLGIHAAPLGQAAGARLDINSASAETLASALKIEESLAKNIVSYREKEGKFSSVDGLKKVPGMTDAIFNSIQDRVAVK
ncbi:MAG: helix-hairpin-helix domain-containing protein [Acidobacteria bacterium]|nr:helix-hairpin-helix domain-containing protein [Acidobacteriota bacterium]